MSSPGKGCDTCQARGIKCDGRKPRCTQCERSRRVCKGLGRERPDLVYRDENDFASGSKLKRPKGPAKRSRTERSIPPRISTTPLGPLPTPRSGNNDILLDQSLFVLPVIPLPADLGCGFADSAFLPTNGKSPQRTEPPQSFWSFIGAGEFQWGPSFPETPFSLAASAVNLVVDGTHNQLPHLIRQANTKYQKALTEIRTRLSQPTVDASDQLIMACAMLSSYEDRVCDFDQSGEVSEAFKHQDGITALLDIRSSQTDRTEQSLSIDKYIRRQTLRSNLFRGLPIPECLMDGSKYGETGQDQLLDELAVQNVNLRSQVLATFHHIRQLDPDQRASHLSQLKQYLRHGLELDARLRWWTMIPPKEHEYHLTSPDKVRALCDDDDINFLTSAHAYPDFLCALSWNHYRGHRLMLNGLLAKITVWIRSITYPDEPLSLDTIPGYSEILGATTALVNDICASCPYFFGLIDTQKSSGWTATQRVAHLYPVTWALIVSAAVTHIPEEQRAWLKRRVATIGALTGSRLLRAVAEMNYERSAAALVYHPSKPE